MPKIGPQLGAAGRRRLNIRINTDPVMVAISDGLFAVALRIGETASAAAPDAPQFNYGLPENWGAISWALGKLLQAQGADGGTAVSKPRDMRTTRTGADAVVGFGFPGRFNELGTVNQDAIPFLGPAALHVVTSPEFTQILADHFPKGDHS